MSEFFQRLFDFLQKFWPLYTVLAWERAVRVRFGSNVKLLGPGVHLRLPFFDSVTLVNTRLRVFHTEPQTLTLTDGRVLMVSATIGMCIADPLAAAMKHHNPEYAIRSIAQGLIAELVAERDPKLVTPSWLAAEVLAKLRAAGAGYAYEICAISEFGFIRTYRLIQSPGAQGWSSPEERRL